MKHVLTLLTIALLSTAINAADNILTKKSPEKEMLPKQAENDINNSTLWGILDTDKDNSISKEEAIASNDVVKNWDKLDLNKDSKLDTVEFEKIFSLEN